jgi:hypothetical protein
VVNRLQLPGPMKSNEVRGCFGIGCHKQQCPLHLDSGRVLWTLGFEVLRHCQGADATLEAILATLIIGRRV